MESEPKDKETKEITEKVEKVEIKDEKKDEDKKKEEEQKKEDIKKDEEKKEENKTETTEEKEEKDTAELANAEGIENLATENDLLSKDVSWDELGVDEEIKKSLLEMKFFQPSKIQSTTYPLIKKEPYSHLIAQAKNGAGKTGAFGLGVVSRVDKNDESIQAIILAHTRELVNQITSVLSNIAKESKIKVVGLLNDKDVSKESGQIIVITPGNFKNIFLTKKKLSLEKVKIFVLDEADYMLTNDLTSDVVKRTFKLFSEKKYKIQILFFSATYTQENIKFIKQYYKKCYIIQLKKEELNLKNVTQYYYYAKDDNDKIDFIAQYLSLGIQERIVIFAHSKQFAVTLQNKLKTKGYKVYLLMGGDMDPKERDETVKRFNSGDIKILITTNLLSRGYDEKLIKLVINFDIPLKKHDKNAKGLVADYETYLHRIGRTGRFGTKGIGLTLVKNDREFNELKDIEKFYKSEIKQIKDINEVAEKIKQNLADI
jgi:ATP-dependent RNA helicase DDX19/DBP5